MTHISSARRIAACARAAAVLVSVAVLAAAAPAPSAAPSAPVTVVELFTSQGCARCPPADALLGRLIEEPGLIALSMPVDYWNYLGWTDTRATPENSARQKAYAAVRGDRDVFTPQMVINGVAAMVGSDEAAVRREIERQRAAGIAPSVPIGLGRDGDVLQIRVGAGTPDRGPSMATVWVGSVEARVAATVAKGENAGRDILHRNVVRGLRPVGMWKGEALEIDLPSSEIDRDGRRCVVVLLQAERDEKPGPILGAAFLP